MATPDTLSLLLDHVAGLLPAVRRRRAAEDQLLHALLQDDAARDPAYRAARDLVGLAQQDCDNLRREIRAAVLAREDVVARMARLAVLEHRVDQRQALAEQAYLRAVEAAYARYQQALEDHPEDPLAHALVAPMRAPGVVRRWTLDREDGTATA